MTIREMQEVLGAKFLYGEEHADVDVQYVFSADMMSDVQMFRAHHRAVQSPGGAHCGDARYLLYHLCPRQDAG